MDNTSHSHGLSTLSPAHPTAHAIYPVFQTSIYVINVLIVSAQNECNVGCGDKRTDFIDDAITLNTGEKRAVAHENVK